MSFESMDKFRKKKIRFLLQVTNLIWSTAGGTLPLRKQLNYSGYMVPITSLPNKDAGPWVKAAAEVL